MKNKNSSMFEWAKFYSEEWGCAVVPVDERKRPALSFWSKYQKRLPTPEELKKWFADREPWGMALICGKVSGNLIRLDFDDPADYQELLLKDLFPKDAPTFRSPRGGYGVIVRTPEPLPILPQKTFKNFPKFEVKGEGAITVVPPTPGYEWIGSHETVPEVDMEKQLGNVLGYRPKQAFKAETGEGPDDELNRLLEDTEEGGRSDALVRITNILRSRGLGLEAVKKTIRPHFEEWPYTKNPMSWEEAEGQIERNYGQYEHEGTRYGRQADAFEREFSDMEIDATEFPPEEGPKPYLVDGLVMGEDMANVAMAAYAGTGKTTITLGIALCMAQGRPVWGVLDVPRPLRVVFIDQEEVRGQIQETVNMMAEVFGRPEKGMLTLLSGKGDSYSIGFPESLRRLEWRLDRIRPDFVFLDGWQWFVDQKVSDRDVVGPALAWWKRIRSKYGCGTWIVHHTKKIGAPQFRPIDPLELASGANILMDQARTKLVYEHLTGDYSGYGFLQGRCGRAEWNPIRIVLEYDQTTQSHRLIGREEGMELFDAEIAEQVWGKRKETRELLGLLNWLKRRGCDGAKLAEYLGISKQSVSQWRTGQNSPSAERLAQMKGLAAELEKEGTQAYNQAYPRLTGRPAEYEKMPVPININNVYDTPNSNTIDAPIIEAPVDNVPERTASEDAGPDPSCARCPLRGQPRVGGRGGAVGCVMLIGDGPGETDAETGRAFSGLNGKRLEKLLRKAQIDPNLCRYTHVVACHVPRSRKPPKKAIDCCRPLLEAELGEFRPKTVITLGETAMAAFYPGKLKSYHGTRLQGDGYVLVPMYKPDAYDHAPDLLSVLHDDFSGLKKRPMVRRLEGDYRVVDQHTVPASERCALDTETTGLDLRSKIIGMAICEIPGDAFYLHGSPINRLGYAFPPIVVMHNAKFDLGVLESNGVAMERFESVEDTMLLAYCMNRKPLGLKDLALQELGLEMSRFEEMTKSAPLEELPIEEVAKYCCTDADATMRLWERLWKGADLRERKLYRELEKPLPALLAKMQLNGVYIDVPYLERLGADMGRELEGLESQLQRFGLTRKVLMSPKQLSDFLYRELKLPAKHSTDKGALSTDKEALEYLEGRHPAIDTLLKFRRLEKLKSTFVDGLLERHRNGMVYPNFNQVGTVTGRMSSSEPDMQNLPKREDTTVRKGFVAPEGYAVVSFDNSQIDLRVLAYESKDSALNETFDKDGDAHVETSMAIFGDAEESHRRTAKTANFLVVFGGGYLALAYKAKMPENGAKDFMDAYWLRHAGIKDWIGKTHRLVAEQGYVETLYGRRRYLPKVYTKQRSAALREAQNMPIQGGSSDVIKLQMAAVMDLATPFAQIHDELDFYLPIDGLDDMAREIKARMEEVDCPFRLKVDVGIGPNLGELRK